MRRLALLGAALLSSPAALCAQAGGPDRALPEAMHASFDPQHGSAGEFWLPVDSAKDSACGRLAFDNSETASKVTIDWQFMGRGARGDSATQSIDVPFQPTTVTPRAGTTNVLYVVGWSAATGRVIVETWTLSDYTLGSTRDPDDALVSTFAQPTVTRSFEWASDPDAVRPIWDAACQVCGDDLLLLESGTPTRILSLSLQRAALSELYSSASPGCQALAGHRQLSIGKHRTRGFVAFSETRRLWEPGTSYDATSYQYFLMLDAESDGVFESVAELDHAAFMARFPSDWNLAYSR